MSQICLDNPLSRQVFSLPELAATQSSLCFEDPRWSPLSQGAVYITGCGDSLAAAGAMLPAFAAAGLHEVYAVDPVTLSRMLTGEQLCPAGAPAPTVIVISNSGSADIIYELLCKARLCGAHTLLMTNKEQSRAADEAQRVYLLNTPDLGNTPGLRSFFAGMVGLAAVACATGAARGGLTAEAPGLWRRQITDYLAQWEPRLRPIAREMRELAARWERCTRFEVVGNGGGQYAAMYCMQKFYECGGDFCGFSNTREWAEGNRYASPAQDIGTIFLLPEGDLNFEQGVRAASMARKAGRPVLVVTDGEPSLFLPGTVVCTVPTPNPEYAGWLWPLAVFIPPALLASYRSILAGRDFFGGCYNTATGGFGDCAPYSQAMAAGFAKSRIRICP